MFEILTCIQDWEELEARAQHNVENKELEQDFANLYLDEDVEGESQPTKANT